MARLGRDRGFSIATEVFSVATEPSGAMSRHGSFCRDMVPRLQAVSRSRQGFFWSRQSGFSSIFLSRQGFPQCRDNVLFFVVTMS